MKTVNLTIDNQFRHPCRWGACPMWVRDIRSYGVKIVFGECVVGHIKRRWTMVVYYGSGYRLWSNYRPEE